MTCLKDILEKCRELPPVDVDDTGYRKIGILGKKKKSTIWIFTAQITPRLLIVSSVRLAVGRFPLLKSSSSQTPYKGNQSFVMRIKPAKINVPVIL